MEILRSTFGQLVRVDGVNGLEDVVEFVRAQDVPVVFWKSGSVCWGAIGRVGYNECCLTGGEHSTQQSGRPFFRRGSAVRTGEASMRQ